MLQKRCVFKIALISSFILLGCQQKREFCECMDLKAALTDGFLLSKNDREAKEKGCEWIAEELSPVEIIERTAKCYGVNVDEGNKSTKESTSE